MTNLMPMPTPPPVPYPGGGGSGSYETAFNTNYYQTRDPRLWPFFNQRPGAPGMGEELSSDERDALANALAASGVPFDEQIDYQGWEPYSTMYMRSQVYGMNRVPVGTGTQQGGAVNPSDFHGPVGPGYLLVSVNIADFSK